MWGATAKFKYHQYFWLYGIQGWHFLPASNPYQGQWLKWGIRTAVREWWFFWTQVELGSPSALQTKSSHPQPHSLCNHTWDHWGEETQQNTIHHQGATFILSKFFEQKQEHVGIEPSKTNQTRWEWHHNTFTTFLYILCHFSNYVLCLLFVCIEGLWKAVGWVVQWGYLRIAD